MVLLALGVVCLQVLLIRTGMGLAELQRDPGPGRRDPLSPLRCSLSASGGTPPLFSSCASLRSLRFLSRLSAWPSPMRFISGRSFLCPYGCKGIWDTTPCGPGSLFCSLGVGPVLFSFGHSQGDQRIGNLSTLFIGFVLFSAACFHHGLLYGAGRSEPRGIFRFLFGFAIIFYINPLIGMSKRIFLNPNTHAAGIFHFVRAMVGGIGTSVFTTLWERRPSSIMSGWLCADPLQSDHSPGRG